MAYPYKGYEACRYAGYGETDPAIQEKYRKYGVVKYHCHVHPGTFCKEEGHGMRIHVIELLPMRGAQCVPKP